VLFLAVSLGGQKKPGIPEITFSLDFPNSDPAHYLITVAADGNGTYESNGKLSLQAETGDPVRSEFTLSKATCSQLFDLAKRAHYFAGNLGSKKENIASTGTKTLTYQDEQRNTKATYNYSPMAPVQEITRLFQNLSNTLEFGRRLQFEYRYQKLALAEELKNMESESDSGFLFDMQTISPILQQLVDDHSVMNVARERAQKLLLQGEGAATGKDSR
jgi:hypothetical protein